MPAATTATPSDLVDSLLFQQDFIVSQELLYCRRYDHSQKEHVFTQYEPTQLATVHPELWPALTAVYAQQHNCGEYDSAGYISADYLDAQLQYMTQPLLMVRSEQVAIGITQVHFISWSGAAAKAIYIRGDMYQVTNVPALHSPPFVTEVFNNRELSVFLPEVEKTYPGWGVRFTIAQTLGLDKGELLEYACGLGHAKVNEPGAELPGLLLD